MEETRTCVICGKSYQPLRHNQKTCSRFCGEEYHRQIVRERARQRANPPRLKKCTICGKEFKTPYGHQKCCSPECSELRILNLRCERYRQRHRTIKQCAWCGKEFETTNMLVKYCSETCRVNAHREYDRDYTRRKRAGIPIVKVKAAVAVKLPCYDAGIARLLENLNRLEMSYGRLKDDSVRQTILSWRSGD